MSTKRVSLIINPRGGENFATINEVLAVLAAAGWQTDIKVKEYGGHIMQLAQQAGNEGSDMVIAYGGDGALGQVVNGVMSTKRQESLVGVIPGGTANIWAGDVGIPRDSVRAALALIDSVPRSVDVGYVDVTGLTFPGDSEERHIASRAERSMKKERKKGLGRKSKHHFLLMAGLGIDAAIVNDVSKEAKYRAGSLAVGMAAARQLPSHKAFPVEVWRSDNKSKSNKEELLWQGEALQIIVSNNRRYAQFLEMAPDAYIDDGMLDVAVITAGDPLSTLQQVASLVFRRKPDTTSAEYFQGAHLRIRVPASVPIELDGSFVRLKDYLEKEDYARIEQMDDSSQVQVSYRFDVLPKALNVAVPRTYDDKLFSNANDQEEGKRDGEQKKVKGDDGVRTTVAQQETEEEQTLPLHKDAEVFHQDAPQQKEELPAELQKILDGGRSVYVIGRTSNPAQKNTYIIAGTTTKRNSNEERPAAVVVNDETAIYTRDGVKAATAIIEELREGTVVVVTGSKNKYGVIQAKSMIV